MPFYLFIFSRLVAYPIRQAVQSIGSTASLHMISFYYYIFFMTICGFFQILLLTLQELYIAPLLSIICES